MSPAVKNLDILLVFIIIKIIIIIITSLYQVDYIFGERPIFNMVNIPIFNMVHHKLQQLPLTPASVP